MTIADKNKDTTVLPPSCRCENCRFWQQHEPDEIGGKTGLCVRHAPVFIGLDDERIPEFAQPTTGIYATCGEWENIVICIAEGNRTAEGSFRWIFPSDEGEDDNGADELEPAPF